MFAYSADNIMIISSNKLGRFETTERPNWPPMLGYMDQGIVWRIPPQEMNDTYLTNPRAYYCPMYFYDGTDPYPETYMHGAGYFLPWWAVACIYQQSFQVDFYFLLMKISLLFILGKKLKVILIRQRVFWVESNL